jgi:arylsulfatase A-like enzyme
VLTGKSKALIPGTRETVASLLKQKGYHTAFIGKWHLGWDWALKDGANFDGEGWNPDDFEGIDFTRPVIHTPNELGFDYAYGHSGSLDMAPYVYVENGKITARVNSVTGNKGKYSWWRKGPTANDFDHEQVTPNFFRRSVNYIKNNAGKEKPFFLYLALPSPHTPILPTGRWKGKSNLNPYGDFVMMIDDYVGQLTRAIEGAGIEENTLIIFTSDNGCSPEADFELLEQKGHFPSHIYRGHKADIYEGGHRVPFIARWPAKITAGTFSDKTICTTDFLATCADIVALKPGEHVGEDSFSILPLLEDPNSERYARVTTVHHSINGSFAIRKNQWKLIFAPGSGGWSSPKPGSEEIKKLPKFQLYDLSSDPGETLNLYSIKREITRELTELMATCLKEGRSTPGKRQTNDAPLYGDKNWKQIAIFNN